MEREKLPIAQDGAIYLGRLLGEINYYHLGPAFMEALVNVVLGAEALKRLRTQGINSAELWAMSSSTTTQRTTAAEEVLTQHGIDITHSKQ